MSSARDALVFAALVALAALGLVGVVRDALGRARLRARFGRARRGEMQAERLLEALGFRIEARQARLAWHPVVDGERCEIEGRADLLVSKGGRRFVAEVKTGALAPDVRHAPTRRQLLEYQHAYRADGVLLVAPEAGTVREVGFPVASSARRASTSALFGFLAGTGLGAALTWALLGGG